jgi:ABC-type nickel/cobalt efflux system permease component RcnA
MVDMQLLNGVLVALAVLVGAAITLSIVILAAAAVTQRGHARPGGPGGASGELPRHSAAETDEARRLVSR